MKKTIVFTLFFVCVSLISFGQSKQEQRIIDNTNKFVKSLEENISDLTETEKDKFFEFKKAQITAIQKVNTDYEKGTEEHEKKIKEVMVKFQADVKAEFGNERGSQMIKASLAHLQN